MLKLQEYFAHGPARSRKLLSLFLTAGFPTAAATVPLLQLLDDSGADLIELGMPFSDPLADGPTIQRSSQIALHHGMTLRRVLQLTAEVTPRLRSPLLLMGYYNPIFKFGPEQFVRAAAQAGVQGLIIPDLPPEESRPLQAAAQAAGLSLIYLVSPNTSPARLQLVDELTTSFVYAVSVTGVTGARRTVAASTIEFLQRLRRQLRHPVLVGFGVANAADARLLASYCDGVIVGSALLEEIEKQGVQPAGRQKIAAFVHALRAGLDHA
ncbi:MAG: tryptophan synthase subunit alpha [candidate division KSB1 bacterium]|nr:tryptophan synthase subunit alpha [candidate division KSB1 bacterium]MDZ7275926.1 tryptophan synthase subunit alpha [candidate division KSB1 bacterium]MDZ7285792.1 tryptophan synthase subunit alpha [candidate division KSB1 bacterium]MDZ7298824.1 tryptophan synthase subunit alpha [candidate division KSB1 bacterium]MDZ7308996.1 tryptophan synthase subunit alpha [candidate division KSB1 bacterium]